MDLLLVVAFALWFSWLICALMPRLNAAAIPLLAILLFDVLLILAGVTLE